MGLWKIRGPGQELTRVGRWNHRPSKTAKTGAASVSYGVDRKGRAGQPGALQANSGFLTAKAVRNDKKLGDGSSELTL